MSSKTKEMRDQEELLKQKIVSGHRRGVCDSEGRTVKMANGRPVAKPRVLGSTARKIH